jgi:cobalt-zinc-cadmium efflux system protein
MSAGHHHHDRHADEREGLGRGRAFALGVALNTGFLAIEAAAGFVSGSMALIADAGHNLSDVLSLLIAWGASVLSARRTNWSIASASAIPPSRWKSSRESNARWRATA